MTMPPRNELLEKLTQIYEQAELTLGELPKGLAKDRLRLIVGLAKYLKTAGELGDEPSDPRGERSDFSRTAAIGNVPNLAARLCGAAHEGEVIVDGNTEQDLARIAEMDSIGPLNLRGFLQPIAAFRLKSLR